MKRVSQREKAGSDVVLSKDTLAAMEELGLVLKSIYLEMRKKGYRMIDGKIVRVDDGQEKETERRIQRH